ncbi:unnamed protein product [Phaeothamnion confervicola]
MKNASIVAALALAISFLSGNDAFAVRPATLAVRARPISATNSALKHVTGRRLAVLRMADEESSTMTAVEEEAPEEPAVNAEFGSAGFFAPSANVRFGTSRDQDGKSNVWAIEPKMKVSFTIRSWPNGRPFIKKNPLSGGSVETLCNPCCDQ